MKFLMLATLLFSSSAFACPDLSGSYTCNSGSRVVSKDVQLTSTGYIINTDGVDYEYFTNGTSYDIPETDSYKDMKIVSSCSGDQFLVHLTATILYDGSVIGKQVTDSTYSMKGDNLMIVQKVKMKRMPLPVVKYVCTKN